MKKHIFAAAHLESILQNIRKKYSRNIANAKIRLGKFLGTNYRRRRFDAAGFVGIEG